MAVVLFVVIFLAALLAWFLIRRRRRVQVDVARPLDHSGGRELTVAPSHPAARVTPFSVNLNGEPTGPQFNHQPGQGMRIAHRRDDGGWDFVDPNAPPTPFTAFPSSSRSSLTSTLASYSTFGKKEKLKPGELTTRGFVEADALGLAPPAYNYA